MPRKTQNDRVLERLQGGYSITQEDCDHMAPKIKRLAARIYDLQQQGHRIKVKTITTPGGARVAQYSLEEKPKTQHELWLEDADRLYDERRDDQLTNPEWFE